MSSVALQSSVSEPSRASLYCPVPMAHRRADVVERGNLAPLLHSTPRTINPVFSAPGIRDPVSTFSRLIRWHSCVSHVTPVEYDRLAPNRGSCFWLPNEPAVCGIR